MRLLLDTHVLIGLSTARLALTHPAISFALARAKHDTCASVVGLWEIAIKTRLGKLDPGLPLADLAAFFEAAGLAILPIDQTHVVAEIYPEPTTRDPFDRLLLAQCKVERRMLVTVDQAIVGHPLAVTSF